MVFGCHPRTEDPTILERTSFRESSFERCLFAHTRLERSDFRSSEIVGCDFRYATFAGAQLANATVRLTDFYRAAFTDGTVMSELLLELVSLTSARLDEASDLEWRSFERDDGVPALV